jgi:IS30 family transposase
MISALRRQGIHAAAIARNLGRHRSTISRELRRNATRHDGRYRAAKAIGYVSDRRRRCRRKSQFGPETWRQVEALLRDKLSPEQIAGYLRLHLLDSISHETIYRHVYRDRRRGGGLHRHLRLSGKRRRKRYRSIDSRGQLQGKRSIHERPARVERRAELGHWEVDTVMGKYGTKPCIVTLVERKSGFVLIGKMKARTAAEANRALLDLMHRHPSKLKTITADNGTEFHSYEEIERQRPVKFFFATPYHSWERGSNENTNGLIRQYLPKGMSLVKLTQEECDAIAHKLNHRPRKRHGFKTPAQIMFRK